MLFSKLVKNHIEMKKKGVWSSNKPNAEKKIRAKKKKISI